MAKIKSMNNRNLIGTMGGAVYYMSKGQNIGREKAAQVSNPRSVAQQEQRMRLGNLVAFYRGNQPWMKQGAFESKKTTWSDYNAFVSANSKVSPVYLTKGQVERGACVIAPYIVTKGTLPAVACEYYPAEEEFVSDLYIGNDLTISAATTAAELSAALRANNNGLQLGDQISVIHCIQQTDNEAPSMIVRAYEFIIDESDNRTLAQLGLDAVLIGENNGTLECLTTPFAGAGGAAFIVSRTSQGAIKVSTQSLVLTPSQETFLALFTSDAAFENASASYGESDENFLASGYSRVRANSDVPLSQSILSVAGVPAGGTAPTIEAGNLSVQLAQNAASVSAPTLRLRYTQSNNVYLYTTVPNDADNYATASVEGNVVTIAITGEIPPTNELSYITLDVDGQTIRADFQLSAAGSGDPGDVTP